MKEKLVIVINGVGGSGKDTLVNLASKHYKCVNISSVDPIKELARKLGWNGEKDEKSRKMLSDLKATMTSYNGLPQKYVMERYERFLESDNDILFVHIREPNEIWKFVAGVKPRDDILVRKAAILIKRGSISNSFGNTSDDNVENYPYDAVFTNDYELQEAEVKFVCLIKDLIDEYGLSIEAH